MTYQSNIARTLVFRAQRETIVLVLAAVALTFALSYSVRARHGSATAMQQPAPQKQVWAGDLAGLPDTVPSPSVIEPLTSASMVVAKSDLALPPMPAMRSLVKLRGCGEANCTRPAPPVAPRRTTATADPPTRAPARPRIEQASLISRINPLRHLPGISRPFVYAGRTLTGWFRQF